MKRAAACLGPRSCWQRKHRVIEATPKNAPDPRCTSRCCSGMQHWRASCKTYAPSFSRAATNSALAPRRTPRVGYFCGRSAVGKTSLPCRLTSRSRVRTNLNRFVSSVDSIKDANGPAGAPVVRAARTRRKASSRTNELIAAKRSKSRTASAGLTLSSHLLCRTRCKRP